MGSDLISFPYTDASSDLAAARARVAGMETELRLALGVEATESWQSLLSRVRGLLPIKKAIGQISDALGCHDTNPSVVLDAVTRLVEVNGRLTSETSSALATERKAHQDTKARQADISAAQEQRRLELIEILTPVAKPDGPGMSEVVRAARRAAAELLLLRSRTANYEREISELKKVGAIHVVDPERDEDGDDWEMPTAEPVISAIESLIAAMATSDRDWKANPLDAWLYGVIIGWSFNDMCDVAEKHGWPDSLITRLGDLHAAVMGASGYDGGDE